MVPIHETVAGKLSCNPFNHFWGILGHGTQSDIGAVMYIVNVPIQIKEGFKEQFVAGIKENASHAQNDEPGCLLFNVIQDASDSDRVWVYEVYKDEDAFKAHQQTSHYLKFRGMSDEWRAETSSEGAGRGCTNIWPPDHEWS
jgi:quinol monooxygenase YgiN